MACQNLPEQFIIKQDFISLRKTFSIHNTPPISNNDMNNNKILASKLRNISKMAKIASYKTKLLTLRGTMGLPRIRMYYRKNANKKEEILAATANAKGSYKLSAMRDMRYIFRCGNETFHVQEKKEGFLKNLLKNELGLDGFKMNFEVFKQSVSNNNYKRMKHNNNSLRKSLIAKVKVSKTIKLGKVVTKVRFFQPDDTLMKNVFMKRVSTIRNVKSLLRSKFIVHNKSNMNGYLLGLIAYVFANNEMKTLSKGAKKLSYVSSLLS